VREDVIRYILMYVILKHIYTERNGKGICKCCLQGRDDWIRLEIHKQLICDLFIVITNSIFAQQIDDISSWISAKLPCKWLVGRLVKDQISSSSTT
jgi:hypothetical protein